MSSRRSSYDIQTPTKIVKDDFNTNTTSHKKDVHKVYNVTDSFSKTQPNFYGTSNSVNKKDSGTTYVSKQPGQYVNKIIKKADDINILTRPTKLSITNEPENSYKSIKSNISPNKSTYSLK